MASCSFLPDTLLQQIANDKQSSPEVRYAASQTIEAGHELKALDTSIELGSGSDSAHVTVQQSIPGLHMTNPSDAVQLIYDANNQKVLPGNRYNRKPSDSEVESFSIVYHRIRHVYNFFDSVFKYKLLNGTGSKICTTLHYGEQYVNAFWKSKPGLLVLGDGDNVLARDFTNSLDVLAHELTHAIIQNTSKLRYKGESGALNEHLADVFGILCLHHKHYSNHSATEAPWVIGSGAFLEQRPSAPVAFGQGPNYEGYVGKLNTKTRPAYLRSFAEPGNAVPSQPWHYNGFVVNGDVHINSGIPNFAFYRAALAAGGSAWDGVGRPWFQAMIDLNLGEACTISRFAAFTLYYASKSYPQLEKPIRAGWLDAGVTPKY